ncbi:unnamed protein product [Blepharisma stoltei]|uniref:Uncharacterized protein n=1 Tax=Blepharisma stoltei TaxID=1481888 RepID=A0AAU9IH36_9CILI|nr:unnamed protein product [Blepharisma stoltei]
MECGECSGCCKECFGWENPIKSGAFLAAANIFFFTIWLYDVSFLQLSLYALIFSIIGFHAYRTIAGEDECCKDCCNKECLEKALEISYEAVNKALGHIRKQTQGKKIYGLIAGLLVLTIIPTNLFCLSWILINACSAIKAAKKFAGIDLKEMCCTSNCPLSDQFSHYLNFIPRARSCRKND